MALAKGYAGRPVINMEHQQYSEQENYFNGQLNMHGFNEVT
jgi:hypothetical protein